MKVHLIEDEAVAAEALQLFVQVMVEDVQIIHRTTGSDAGRVIADEKPDLVLLDIELPGEDGFSILRKIRTFSDVPVIMVTADESEETAIRCLMAGADDYVRKPFAGAELLARMTAILLRSEPGPTDAYG